jgi:hypothetical protein
MGTHGNSGFDIGANVHGSEPNANGWPNKATRKFGNGSSLISV